MLPYKLNPRFGILPAALVVALFVVACGSTPIVTTVSTPTLTSNTVSTPATPTPTSNTVSMLATPTPTSNTVSMLATPTLAPPRTDEPTLAWPTPTTVPGAPGPSAAMVIQTTNVRNIPTVVGSTVLGEVEESTVVRLRLHNADSSWYVVEAPNGLVGWVTATLLSNRSCRGQQGGRRHHRPWHLAAPGRNGSLRTPHARRGRARSHRSARPVAGSAP